jgi:hypothetical protein
MSGLFFPLAIYFLHFFDQGGDTSASLNRGVLRGEGFERMKRGAYRSE